MKARESGMPGEALWNSFFYPDEALIMRAARAGAACEMRAET